MVPRSATTLTLKKVKVKVTGWRHLKWLVTRIMHAKYQCSIFNTSEDMSQVKVFVTDRRTEGQRDGQTDGRMRFNVGESGGQKAIRLGLIKFYSSNCFILSKVTLADFFIT